MQKITSKDLIILAHLRKNARERLTKISRITGIPVSTIFDRLKLHEHGLITKHTTLLDFNLLGFVTRATIILKVNKHDREKLQQHLYKNKRINTAYRINNGYDFLIDVLTKNMKELEEFLEDLEKNYNIYDKRVYYVIDYLKQEAFLSDYDIGTLFNK